VYYCRRQLKGADKVPGAIHTFIWVDRDCDGKWDPGEFIGFGGSQCYEPTPRQKSYYPLGYPGQPEMPQDVEAYFTTGIGCEETDCDAGCVDKFLAAYFGPGKCYDPTVPAPPLASMRPMGPGGYCGLRSDRRCWTVADSIVAECDCRRTRGWKKHHG
jgi:hypothetical protein